MKNFLFYFLVFSLVLFFTACATPREQAQNESEEHILMEDTSLVVKKIKSAGILGESQIDEYSVWYSAPTDGEYITYTRSKELGIKNGMYVTNTYERLILDDSTNKNILIVFKFLNGVLIGVMPIETLPSDRYGTVQHTKYFQNLEKVCADIANAKNLYRSMYRKYYAQLK